MGDEVIRADQERALQFAAEPFDGLISDHGMRRRQIDQITIMDGERVQVVLFAMPTQTRDLFRVRGLGAPHPRAGGEDLERVRAEFGGLDSRAFERASSGTVNADSQESG